MTSEPTFIPCVGGLFVLPPDIQTSLSENAAKGLVYIRQDDETLTISPFWIQDGKRRRLAGEMKVGMFRTASRLAILPLPEGIRIMAVEWRNQRRVQDVDYDH